ncbi:hypothetical protein GMLC_08140 [Geomonas limicola]|uniref:histidine kinase n=1 Tax=Geomonas limicola TaxID=2740186 RepID=A0A6V8N3V3_9BACT|nr:PAS domain-containing protein [Geomonas limicola]GFO67235.1 hypothetical protein GMLC_08140 [Geomonas limicola]
MKRSIRNILTIQALVIAIVPVLIILTFSIFRLIPEKRSEIEKEQLQLAKAIASQVELQLESSFATLADVALVPMDENLGWHNIQHLVDANMEASATLQAIYVLDLKGIVRAVQVSKADREQIRDFLGIDLSRNNLAKEAAAQKKQIWSDNFLSLVSGKSTVAVAYPSSTKIVIGEMSLDLLSTFLDTIDLRHSQIVLVLDKKGQVIADPHQSMTAQQFNVSNIPLVQRAMLEKIPLSSHFSLNSTDMVGSIIPIARNGWYVLVAEDKRAAFSSLSSMTLTVTVSGIIAILLGMLLAVRSSLKLSSRFEQIAFLARAFSEGNYQAKLPQTDPIVEFNSLASDLERMAECIVARERQTADLNSELHYSEQRLHLATSSAAMGVWDWDVVNNTMVWDRRMIELYGYTPDSFPGGIEAWQNGLHPEDRERAWSECQAALRGEEGWDTVFRILRPDRTVLHIKADGTVLRDDSGAPVRMLGVNYDITARHTLFQQMQTVLDALDALVYVADFDTHEILFINRYGRDIFGDISGKTCWQELQAGQAGPCPFCTNKKLVRPDGTAGEQVVWEFRNTMNNRWFECRDQAIPWSDGRLVRLEIATDITERKRFEDEYRTFIKTAKEGFWITNRSARILDVNDAYCRMSGYAAEEILGRCISDFDVNDDPFVVKERMEKIIDSGHTRFETRHRDKSGVIYDVEVSTSYLKDRDSFCVFIRDIREQKQAEQDNLRLSHMLQESQHIAHIGGWEIDFGDKSLYWSKETYLIHETTPEEYSPTIETAIGFYAPESLPIVSAAVKEAIEEGKDFQLELDLVTAKGRRIRVFTTSKVIRENGVTTKIIGAFQDITDRRRLEEQLRQSQKMEAVGQLAGGVAHDFNNILTVISGYSSLLMMDGSLNDLQKRNIEEIAASAEKAAQLTHGLLAFSRKQTLVMKPENLNHIIQHVHKFLGRIIGEDVILNTSSKDTELPIVADRGQMEQVLINLATNARDAMPGGGVLTVTSELVILDSSFADFHNSEVPLGRYALLTVSDTGAGIFKEHIQHIFEPFFTTKEVGKGTGLGMAIIYGIIKQHNGFINVYSEPGRGTTFRIYLPLQELNGSSCVEMVEAEPPKGGDETILVAEDDPAVGRLVSKILEGSGYEVILAEDGEDAVEKFQANQDRIDLVLMDMIMPKQNGREALEKIERVKPGIKAIFSSGYTADFIESRGMSEMGVELVMKPVQPRELLKKIRQLLDA